MYCGLLSFDVLHNVYKVIKSGNECTRRSGQNIHVGVDVRCFGNELFIICAKGF